MHSKTLFKFLFNSPKTSTTSVHFIFFLNTTLHYGPNKIRTTPLGSTKLQIWILQNSLKTGINELASYNIVTDRRGPLVSWAHAPVTQNRGADADRMGTTELTGGEVSGQIKCTNVLP